MRDNASALSSSLANTRGIREGQNLGPSVPFSYNLQFSEPLTLAQALEEYMRDKASTDLEVSSFQTIFNFVEV